MPDKPNLAKAYVQIVPSADGIKGQLGQIMQSEGESAGQGAGSGFASFFGKAAIGAGIGAVAAKVAGAVAGAVRDSVESYADYEQLVGGVETLFKGSASTVQNYAKQAYQTAGLSANEYMEQVTSFSASLISSLGGDTAEAAEKGNMAIVDMADNVNKMGSSMESVQNAYQGFAKQNYTMLDNLKLGYGGTKSEMERLLADAERIKRANGEMADYSINSFADIVDAIHVVQTEMGITGTTAEEAEETISGSAQSMQAAWGNLMTGMGDETQSTKALVNDFADSAVTYLGNVLPAIGNTVEGVFSAVGSIVEEVFALMSGADQKTYSLQKSLEGITENAELQKQVTDENAASALVMIARIDELAQKEEKSALEKEQLAIYVEKLNELMPGLNLEYDKMADSLNMSAEGMRDFVEQAAKQQALAIYQDELAEAYKLQADAFVNLARKQNDADEANKAYADGLDDLDAKLADNMITADAYQTEVERLIEAQDSAAFAQGQAQKAYDDASDAVTEVEGKVTEYAEALGLVEDAEEGAGDAAKGMTDAQLAAAEATKKATREATMLYAEIYNAARGNGDLRESYDELSGELERLRPDLNDNQIALIEQELATLNLRATMQELVTGYPDAIRAVQDYGWSVGQLSQFLIDNGITAEEWGSQIGSTTESIINSFQKIDTDLGLSLDEMAGNMRSNIDTYAEWNDNMARLTQQAADSTSEGAAAFVEYLRQLGPGAAVQVAALADDTSGQLEEFGAMFDEAGQEAVEAFFGPFSTDTSVPEAAAGLIEDAAAAADEAADWEDKGGQYMTDLSTGIQGAAGEVTGAAESVVLQAQDAAAGAGSWVTLGYDMASGIALGIDNGGTAVSEAVRRIVADALAAGQDEADSHSPSRRFAEELGAHLPTGIALGIEDNMDPLLRASRDMIDRSLIAAQSAQLDGYASSASYDDGTAALLETWLPRLANMQVVMQEGTLVGVLTPGIDSGLWTRANYAGRGLAG